MGRKRFVLGLLIGLLGGWRVLHQPSRWREEGAAHEAAKIVSLEAHRRQAGKQKHAGEDARVIDASEPAEKDTMKSARAGVDVRLRDAVKKRPRGAA